MFLRLIPYKTPNSEEIARAFTSKEKLVILRAPAGSGKTSVAMAYAYHKANMGEKTAIFFRTTKEVEHALEILSLINKEQSELLIMPAPSKEKFCVLGPPLDMKRYWCPINKCPRIKRRSHSDLELFLKGRIFGELEDYKRLFARGERCPYYVGLGLLKKADIIVATHPYIIRSDLYEKLGKIDNIIVDEAHGLIINVTFQSNYDRFIQAKRLYEELSPQNIGKLIVGLWDNQKYEESRLLALYDEYRIAEGVDLRIGQKIMKALPPIQLTRKLLEQSKKLVFMSSTLYPLSFFEKLFANTIPHDTYLIKGLVGGNRKIVIPAIDLTTAYSQRNSTMLRKYAEAILKIKREYSSKTIVFFPNKEMAQKVARILGMPTEKETEGLLITTFRGKYSEGIDLPDYKIAIMAGLPFPKIDKRTHAILKLYSKVYGLPLDSITKAYSYSSMVSALIQAMGRVGRRGFGLVFILDKRARALLAPLL